MASGASNAGDGSPRILLVDDEHSVQTLLAYPLRKDGYEVVAARDGREALDRFAEQRFDLVVLDLMLPKLDGIGSAGACGAAARSRSSS
jgi:DNA-binding response OmpR family regulator